MFIRQLLTQPVVAFFACTGFSIICNAPRKEIPFCGMNGFIGWLVYLLAYEYSASPVTSTVISTMVVTAVARYLSQYRHQPSILYHIPGILPLVPGAAVYYTVTASLSEQIVEAYTYALLGLKLAGAIGVGSLLVLVIPHQFFSLSLKKTKKT